MVLGGVTIALLFIICYFVWSTGSDQNLDLDFSTEYFPKRTTVTATRDFSVPPEVIWKALTNLSNYKLWYPWVRRLRVTNENADRWVHKHSLLEYKIEVGNWFKIQPFLGAPYSNCRFIALEAPSKMVLEMRFFPFNREVVTFNLTAYKNCVEVNYTATSNSLHNFLTATMFSWRGKKVLRNLGEVLPKIELEADGGVATTASPQFVFDDNFINALIAKAFDDGADILNSITEKPVRGKAKSGLIKAKRSGVPPDTTPEALEAVNQFLSGGVAPPLSSAPPSVSAKEPDEETLINTFVANALGGDEDPIANIEDRVLRSKVKSALMKAKRSGVVPEIPESPPEPATPSDSSPKQDLKTPPKSADSPEEAIAQAVQAALGGNMDLINSIKDRMLRGKAKSALAKAKRAKG